MMINRAAILFFFGILGNVYAWGPKLEGNRGQYESHVFFAARAGGVDTAVTASGSGP